MDFSTFILFLFGKFVDFIMQAAIPAILKDIPDDFFDERLSFLKDKAQYAFDRVDDIATLTCYMKPEACTFIWVLYFALILNYIVPFYFFEIETIL